MNEKRIKVNSAKCRTCGAVLRSEHRFDYRVCGCGRLGISGGKTILKRFGGKGRQDHFDELSEYEEEEELPWVTP